MTAESAIHAVVFVLLLVGLCILNGGATYNYINDLILKIAGITLSWGIILLALYVTFKKADWRW